MFNKRTNIIIGHALSLHSILFSYYNSTTITHFLSSLLFHSDNITSDTMNVSLLKKVVAVATSSSHGQGGDSGQGRSRDGGGGGWSRTQS
mmetsp:Transcript_25698/g.29442  ORF Transcript_25698/g.29442 Transcript_25698/m.29442 type:complete len:90 (+) Transcript_25698:884-1153(+)